MSEQVISKENNSINSVSDQELRYSEAVSQLKEAKDTIETQRAEIEDLKQQIAVLNKTLFG